MASFPQPKYKHGKSKVKPFIKFIFVLLVYSGIPLDRFLLFHP